MGSRFYSPDFGDVKIAGGKWKRKSFLIMQAEARAVRLALSAFSTILPSTTDVWVDNTSPLLAANKRSSKSHALTWELQRIYVFFDSRGVQASFACHAVVFLHLRTWRRGGTCEGQRRCLVAAGPQSLPPRK
ncbi:target of rapamycin (TOR) kinase 1 [Trypanosoma cruzi]|nr:target of rapamycin (TOR) kinase 1 [Trypanosoma cruzi]